MEKENKLKLMLQLFSAFFKIGFFTFGGGYAMIPLIEKEVISKGWVKEEDIIDIFAVAQSVPGAIAINSSTFIGYKVGGVMGAVAATAGVVIPSFITITVIAAFFTRFQDHPVVQAAFSGIGAAVVGLILMAAIKIVKASVKDGLTALLTAIAVILVIGIDIHAIFVIIGGAFIGLMVYLFSPSRINKLLEKGE